MLAVGRSNHRRHLVCRPKVLGFVLEVVRELAMPPENILFVAQVLDVHQPLGVLSRLPNTSGRLRDNPLERIDFDDALLALVNGATLFLERATNRNEPVLEEDVFREECRLLHAPEL